MRYMMTNETMSLPFPAAQLSYKGLDINDHGAWLAIIETPEDLRLRTAATDVALELGRSYAMVRWLGDKALVVCARIHDVGDINAWVIDVTDGTILKCFSVGDGIQDVVVLEDFIVISYFDEGVYGDNPISKEGISVFDQNGAFQWGYHSGVANPVMIDDCYAACKIGPNRITFCAYADFVLVELDLTTRQQAVYDIPQELNGASAITALSDATIFHGPYPEDYDHRTPRPHTYAFDRASGRVAEIGPIFSKWSRGLSGGRMLSITDKGALITQFVEQPSAAI